MHKLFKNFTKKSYFILGMGTKIGRDNGNVQIMPSHNLLAMLQFDGYLANLIGSSERVNALKNELELSIGRLSRQSPLTDPQKSHPNLLSVYKKAKELAESNGDTFVALDKLLIAILEDSDISSILVQAGLNKVDLLAAIQQGRGSAKATSLTAENTFDALNKYGTDLIALAQSGKFDPVIGRDDEIRRVIMVLARRTKNNPVLVGPPVCTSII